MPKPKSNTRITPFAVYFDGMSWPNPAKHCDEVEHALRYGDPEKVRFSAASFVAAFRALVTAPRAKRDRVVRELRKALEERG